MNTITFSDSITGSLCREIDKLRLRCQAISKSIDNCRDCALLERLIIEHKKIEVRRKEILGTALLIETNTISDKLSIQFLIEVSKRPLTFIQKTNSI